MFWLYRGKWPEAEQESALQTFTEAKKLTMEEYMEISWTFDAPRHRILKLLWHLLQNNHSEEYFLSRFTVGLDEFAEDAIQCTKVLPQIQKHLRWVLKGIDEVSRQDFEIGQGNWGEEWFMSHDRAAFVRKQLSKVHLDIFEKPSDYEEMQGFVMDYSLNTRAQLINIPLSEPNRDYIGEVLNDNSQMSMRVWVAAGNSREGLVNADSPWQKSPGSGFGWGSFGGGPRVLAASLLADATGGDVVVANQYWQAFRDDVVSSLPMWKPFRLSRVEILSWLSKQGIGEEKLLAYGKELQKRRVKYEPELSCLRSKLEKIRSVGGLKAQRFDFVPKDFESALYVDLMEMLKRGGRIMHCARCGLPIAYNGSTRSNRQRARWETRRPIYHDQCGLETTTERKREYWHKRVSDPEFRVKRNQIVSETRLAKAVEKLIKQGEGQRIEFKQSFASQNEAIKSLCAFAHADGGTIIFGIKNDRTITGVDLGNNTLENFANAVRNSAEPPLTISIEQITIDGNVIAVARIRKARKGQLFHAFNTPYIRVGKTNQVMSSEEQKVRLITIRSRAKTH